MCTRDGVTLMAEGFVSKLDFVCDVGAEYGEKARASISMVCGSARCRLRMLLTHSPPSSERVTKVVFHDPDDNQQFVQGTLGTYSI